MKTIVLVMALLDGLLLFSTAVCGLWIRFGGDKVTDPADAVRFHMSIGLATGAFTLATLLLAVVNVYRLSA